MGLAVRRALQGLLLGAPEAFDLLRLCGVSSRGFCPRVPSSACTWWRMLSTISGLDNVVVSPTSPKLEIAAMTRRMIFPDRVLGISGTIHTRIGRAILPMWLSMAGQDFAFDPLAGRDAGLERDVHLHRPAADLVHDRNGRGLGDFLPR